METTSKCRKAEGKRLQLLRVVLRKTVDDTLGGISLDQWKAILSPVAALKPKVKVLHPLFYKQATKEAETSIGEAIEDTDLDTTLNKREILISEQEHKSGTLAWRPSGLPETDIIAHDVAALQEVKSQLQHRLQRQEQAFKDVFEEVFKDDSDILKLDKNLHVFFECLPKGLAHIEEFLIKTNKITELLVE